jgi:hypothetical protein
VIQMAEIVAGWNLVGGEGGKVRGGDPVYDPL